MRRNLRLLSAVMVAARRLLHRTRATLAKEERPEAQVKIALPAPDLAGRMPLEQALAQRRSLREFSGRPLSREELSQLLWAAQGITAADGRRTAPSASALYALEVYVAAADGFYHYAPAGHELELQSKTDLRPTLYWAAQCRSFLRDAAAPPDEARELYEYFVEKIRAVGLRCETGRFQETMQVELVNEGPVTILLDSAKMF